MRISDDRSFRDPWMSDQRALDLGGAEAMAGDIDDVVDPPGQPVEPVLVPAGAVTGKIQPGEIGKIGLYEAPVIAENRAHHAGPRIGDAEISFAGTVDDLAVIVDDDRLHAKERPSRRARLQWCRAGDRGDQDTAGFGLPPGIDDRAALLADMIVVPEPRLGIDRFSDAAEDAQ